MKKVSVCVITGSRAEYGILKPLLQNLKKNKQFKLQLIVTGSHLSNEFGMTVKEIENDQFRIDKKIEILLSSDTKISISKSVGLGLISFSETIEDLSPDLILILGDRYEIFAAAIASMILNIPIAHLHGGELTIGAIDDSFRHCITKMSSIHFAASLEYQKRIVQLGENPKNVFNVGGLGVENIKKIKLKNKEELEQDLKIKFLKKNLMITFHPETLGDISTQNQIKELLDALNEFKDTLMIFTMPNADNDSRIIIESIKEFVYKFPNSIFFKSLGALNYLSCLQFVDGVVGNSSSGIIEVPSFKIGTVNIGNRQSGRIKSKSIIDCNVNKKEIIRAINNLYDYKFKKSIENSLNPYGDGETSSKIIDILSRLDLKDYKKKLFYDIDF